MTNRRFLVLESGLKKYRDSGISDITWNEVKVGPSALSIKEGTEANEGKLDFGAIDLLNNGGTLLNSSLIGANNGLASLDANGKIPTSQLNPDIMNYKGLWFGQDTIARIETGVDLEPSGSATLHVVADTAGDGGNAIELVFDGVADLDTVLGAWNSANPSNTASLGGNNTAQGTDVITAGTYTASGGHNATVLTDGAAADDSVGDTYLAFNDGSHTDGRFGAVPVKAGDYLIKGVFDDLMYYDIVQGNTSSLQQAYDLNNVIDTTVKDVAFIVQGPKGLQVKVSEGEANVVYLEGTTGTRMIAMKSTNASGITALIEYTDFNDNTLTLAPPAEIDNSYSLVLPSDIGAEGQTMVLDDEGKFIWADVGGAPVKAFTNNTGSTISALTPCLVHSAGDIQALADASALATANGMIVIAAEEIVDAAEGLFYLPGAHIEGLSAATPGQYLFLGATTPGEIVTTAPSGDGECIRVLGWTTSATEFSFFPEAFAAEIISE